MNPDSPPSEMVLVPRVPTPEMMEAGREYAECAIQGNAGLGYRAMIEAHLAAHPSAAPQGAQPVRASDEQVTEWAARNDLGGTLCEWRAICEDAQTLLAAASPAPCNLCVKGFPLEDGEHYGTQALGMIPNTRCTAQSADAAPVPQEVPSDAKRMDWLDARRDTLIDCYMQDGKLTYILRHPWGAPIAHGNSVRAAIDAAMSAGLTIPAKEQMNG